jgi:hypothetical protein
MADDQQRSRRYSRAEDCLRITDTFRLQVTASAIALQRENAFRKNQSHR